MKSETKANSDLKKTKSSKKKNRKEKIHEKDSPLKVKKSPYKRRPIIKNLAKNKLTLQSNSFSC